jgi:hypothetical protein
LSDAGKGTQDENIKTDAWKPKTKVTFKKLLGNIRREVMRRVLVGRLKKKNRSHPQQGRNWVLGLAKGEV